MDDLKRAFGSNWLTVLISSLRLAKESLELLSSDGVLEDMSLASRILEDNFYSPWPWPWRRGSCPWLHHCSSAAVCSGAPSAAHIL